MERSTADTKKKKSCPVTKSSPVTSVTHDSPSLSPTIVWSDLHALAYIGSLSRVPLAFVSILPGIQAENTEK